MAQAVDSRERRTRQFEHYFDLMEFRARKLAKEDCFVIFSRRVPARLRGRTRTAGYERRPASSSAQVRSAADSEAKGGRE